jgi:MoaA/NifB/PqqE/SkfB family radical SAM enzyme
MTPQKYRALLAHHPADRDGLRPLHENKYLALWEFMHGVDEVRSTPVTLQIARTNSCNFRCVYCSDHRAGNQIPRTNISDPVWQDLVGVVERAEVLAFHGISEFMIDKDFFPIVERCAAAGAMLSLNTNGSVCTERHLTVLENYPGTINMNFSLDAATPEMFERIRGWDFLRVLENVRAYVDCFKSRRDRTLITLSFVITRSNVREMVPFIYLAKALDVDSIHYWRLHEYHGLDWKVETKDGGVFDYLKETTGNFVEEYNRQIDITRRVAEIVGMDAELPHAETAPDDGLANEGGSHVEE